MGLHPTPTWKTILPKEVTAGHRGKFLSLTPLPDTSQVNNGSDSGEGLVAQLSPSLWSPAEPHLSLPTGGPLPNLTELLDRLRTLTLRSAPAPPEGQSPKVLFWPESPVALLGGSRGEKGKRIPLQCPPLPAPVRVGRSPTSRPSTQRIPGLYSPVLPTPLAPTTAILTSRRPAAPRQQSAAVLPGEGYSAMVHMFWMRRIAAAAGLHRAGREVSTEDGRLSLH